MEKSRLNIFGRPFADRRTIERASDEWIAMQRDAPDARFLPMHQGTALLEQKTLAWLPHEALPPGWPQWQGVFLGIHEDIPRFALEVPGDEKSHFARHGEFTELRPAAFLLEDAELALFAHGRAVLHWHRLNRFCGGCGEPMQAAAGGHARRCLNEACAMGETYPRIDPAIIVLVTHGERCLLGRQHAWPKGRYSCLAGFAEAGETLEETVRREVYEEAGIPVTGIVYHSSQPWPFPQSLMIGFHARAEHDAIRLLDDELEDARWFSATELRDEVAAGRVLMPSPISVAWNLIRDWYAGLGDPRELQRETELSR